MKKHILKISLFSIVFIILFCYFSNILRFRHNDEITQIENLYSYPKNSIDVLLVGGSRIKVGVSACTLWEKYGIASYTLWGTGQPLWNSYFNLKEALKTQTPKLVVLDVFYLTQNLQYDDCMQLKNILGMRFSWNKIMDVLASVPEGSRMDMLFGFPVYHINYKGFNTFGGKLLDRPAIPVKKVKKLGKTDGSNDIETIELPEKQKKYLMEVIKLLKEKNIPLLLVAFPPCYTEEEQMVYNAVGKIASENNILYLDFNLLYDKIGFENSTDLADYLHCNSNGKRKVTGYLEKYLRENYNLPNRRNDPNPIYRTWPIYFD